MSQAVRAFYDDLADHYHLIYADWPASIERQGAALAGLIERELGPGAKDVLDCACGIGTQALGLAARGHRVTATDLSPAAVARAEREARSRGLGLAFGVADMRDLSDLPERASDAVVAGDNALPHLLTDADLGAALRSMAARLRPGGLLVASTRDYDALLAERPRATTPAVHDDRIVFQVWDWPEDGPRYDLRLFILTRETDGAWRTRSWSTPYRALRRAELSAALVDGGLTDPRWHEPAESGFFQPIVTARRP